MFIQYYNSTLLFYFLGEEEINKQIENSDDEFEIII